MKIALLGYGRMGKEIEQIVISKGHEIVLKYKGQGAIHLEGCDVAIDFSVPDSAFDNISACINANVPVVSGTTGWLDRYDEIVSLCKDKKGAFIYASNFSLGVNVFFELNKYLAKIMSNLSQYNVSIEEIHHTKKLDAPSGTAITLANGIIENTTKEKWELDAESTDEAVSIKAVRTPDVPGTHEISYTSDVDTVDIKHTAHSRKGFASGAVTAAEWLVDKKGVFTMKDVLGI